MSDRTNVALRSEGRTRRQLIAGVAMVAGGIVLFSTEALAEAEEISHSAEVIHQEPLFKASRERIYEALIDTRQFDKVIQLTSNPSLGTKPTRISREAGGAFTIFGGHIFGRQIDLVPNERIVQAWRVDGWNAGVYSIAKFDLVEQGSGTKIVFDHTGFPQGLGKHLAAGWKEHYWEPLQKLVG
jgi:activator of HSP90 ATPase